MWDTNYNNSRVSIFIEQEGAAKVHHLNDFVRHFRIFFLLLTFLLLPFPLSLHHAARRELVQFHHIKLYSIKLTVPALNLL